MILHLSRIPHHVRRIACVGLAICLLAGTSQALDFTFSFTDDPFADSLGNVHVPGTVTGLISGLVDNASGQSAASVVVTSHPTWDVGFGSFDAVGTDLVSGPQVDFQFANTFDVLNGQITDAYFITNFFALNGGTAQLRLNSQDSQEPGANVLRHQNIIGANQMAVGNRDAMQGVTFALVPEPASVVLGAVASVGIWVVARRRRYSTED